MKLVRSVAFGLVLASGAASAHAQSIISRQITEEPVETTVIQGPSGTVVTRRPLQAAPGAVAPTVGTIEVESGVVPAYAPYEPVGVRPSAGAAVTGTVVDETVGVALPARTVRERRPATTRAVRAARAAGTVSRPVTHRARRVAVRETVGRAATLSQTAIRRTAQPVVLDPLQRQTIYRTIVEEQVLPAPVLQTVVVPPVATTGYAVSYPAEVPATVVAAPALAVGSQVPATVALAPMPDAVAVQVPAARPYRYAIVNNRVLLVDPVTSTVVADATP